VYDYSSVVHCAETRPMQNNVHNVIVCPSVTFVHPTQTIEIFGIVSMPFGTLAIS